MITSFLFHKFDTRLADKISVEIRFKADTSTTNYDSTYWIAQAGPPGDPPIYPSLRITNAFITQRSQLYTDPSLLWDLSKPYMKTMIKTEYQAFTLPAAFDAASAAIYTPASPMVVRFRLSDSFALHKRILGLSFAIKWQSTNNPSGVLGQSWGPNICGARIFKGGKLVEDLSSIPKFNRQSAHFLKCLGASYVPLTST
eukprot:gene7297-2965_t